MHEPRIQLPYIGNTVCRDIHRELIYLLGSLYVDIRGRATRKFVLHERRVKVVVSMYICVDKRDLGVTTSNEVKINRHRIGNFLDVLQTRYLCELKYLRQCVHAASPLASFSMAGNEKTRWLTNEKEYLRIRQRGAPSMR